MKLMEILANCYTLDLAQFSFIFYIFTTIRKHLLLQIYWYIFDTSYLSIIPDNYTICL